MSVAEIDRLHDDRVAEDESAAKRAEDQILTSGMTKLTLGGDIRWADDDEVDQLTAQGWTVEKAPTPPTPIRDDSQDPGDFLLAQEMDERRHQERNAHAALATQRAADAARAPEDRPRETEAEQIAKQIEDVEQQLEQTDRKGLFAKRKELYDRLSDASAREVREQATVLPQAREAAQRQEELTLATIAALKAYLDLAEQTAAHRNSTYLPAIRRAHKFNVADASLAVPTFPERALSDLDLHRLRDRSPTTIFTW